MSPLAANTQPDILPRSLSCLNPVIVEDLRRFGRKGDGGYVLPASHPSRIDGVISFGLSDDWSFEEDLSRLRPDLPIHAYDHTIGEAVFRQKVKSSIKDIIFGLCSLFLLRTTTSELVELIKQYQARRGVYLDYKRFFSERALHYEKRVFNRHEKHTDTTIDNVFSRLKDKSHLLLKMDIEGGEYRLIPQILERSESIDLMVIEFHDTEPLRDLFLRSIHEILAHFDIIHVHGNNWGGVAADGLPEVLEISFLSRKFAHDPHRHRNRLPIEGLDFANDPTKPDLALVWCDGAEPPAGGSPRLQAK